MIDIAKKRLPSAVISILVYLSYCGAGWYAARSSIAYIGEQYSMPGWFANDIWAFFIGGLLPFAVFMVLSMFVFRTLTIKVRGNVAAIRYGLNYSVIAANLFLFAFKFIYLAAPLAAGIINTLIDPIVTISFVALYLLYAFKQNYVDKPYFRLIVSQVVGTFITVYAIVAVINIITAVA